MVGDRRRAHARLREAETALPQADNRRDAIGGYGQTAYLFHVSHVLMEGGGLAGGINAMKQSIRIQPVQERQGRVHAYAVPAQRRLRYGHLDASCESWNRFPDEYEHVSSVRGDDRGDDHFATMRADLAPYAKARPVRELVGRAREAAAAKASQRGRLPASSRDGSRSTVARKQSRQRSSHRRRVAGNIDDARRAGRITAAGTRQDGCEASLAPPQRYQVHHAPPGGPAEAEPGPGPEKNIGKSDEDGFAR